MVDGVSADSLNEHYAQISTDDQYVAPLRKYTVREEAVEYISEWRVFQSLDNLNPLLGISSTCFMVQIAFLSFSQQLQKEIN